MMYQPLLDFMGWVNRKDMGGYLGRDALPLLADGDGLAL
jgi:hypothetical protein